MLGQNNLTKEEKKVSEEQAATDFPKLILGQKLLVYDGQA